MREKGGVNNCTQSLSVTYMYLVISILFDLLCHNKRHFFLLIIYNDSNGFLQNIMHLWNQRPPGTVGLYGAEGIHFPFCTLQVHFSKPC
jgi:hypothetical protein